MTEKKRDITELSLDEICDIAAQAGKDAAHESLEAGIEILSKETETGKYVFKKLDENGQIVKRYVTKEELDREIEEEENNE